MTSLFARWVQWAFDAETSRKSPRQTPVRDWSVDEVTAWLKEIGFPQYAELFSQVDGFFFP